MMKFIYIAFIPILAVFIAVYTIILLSYHPPILDKDMKTSTDNLIKNSPALNLQELAAYKDTLQHSMPRDIWEKNLFDPDREGAAGASAPEGLKNVELVGIFSDGNIKGAIILTKTGELGTSSIYGSSIHQGTPSGSQKQQPVPQKVIFKVGDRLRNGLVLESVGDDFVMLRGGKESVKLKMTFSDDNSLKRTAEAAKASAKPPVTIISGAQGAGGFRGGYSSSGASSQFVTPGGVGSGSNVQSQGIFQGYGRW